MAFTEKSDMLGAIIAVEWNRARRRVVLDLDGASLNGRNANVVNWR